MHYYLYNLLLAQNNHCLQQSLYNPQLMYQELFLQLLKLQHLINKHQILKL